MSVHGTMENSKMRSLKIEFMANSKGNYSANMRYVDDSHNSINSQINCRFTASSDIEIPNEDRVYPINIVRENHKFEKSPTTGSIFDTIDALMALGFEPKFASVEVRHISGNSQMKVNSDEIEMSVLIDLRMQLNNIVTAIRFEHSSVKSKPIEQLPALLVG